jgi:hypothetical protein
MFIDWIKIYTSMPIVAPRSKSRISLGIGLGLTMH